MKVVLIFLALVLSLAAALPLEGSTDGSREDRAKKESAKLRLMDTVSNSRPSTTVTKERQSTNETPVKEEVDVSVSRSESTVVSKVSKPEGTVSKMERQRSIADQALRERLRQSSRTKDHHPAVPTSTPEKIEEAKEEEDEIEYPPVVYVPLPGTQALRLAPYFPVMRPPSTMSKLNTKRLQFWPFAHLFPLIINDPVVTLSGGFDNWIEYGPAADVCNPSKGKLRLGEEETEVSMESGGVVSKLIVRGGGVAIAGPGGVATAGRGGTAIVGPGGIAYTSPGAMAVVGPGGKVIRRGGDFGEGKIEGRSLDMTKGGVVVARGPVIYYDSSEDQK